MEAFRDTIETFFTPDGQGACPVFDRDALNTVLDRLSEVRHAYTYWQDDRISDRLDALTEVFASVNVTGGKTLEDAVNALEILNYRTVEEPERAGAAMSSRGMIQATTGDGKTVNGFFTRNERVGDPDPSGELHVFLRAKQQQRPKDAQYQTFLRNLLEQPDGLSKLILCMDPSYHAPKDAKDIVLKSAYDSRSLVASKLLPTDRNGIPNLTASVSDLLKDIRAALPTKQLQGIYSRLMQYGPRILDAENGGSIAMRNVAMSRMANLLGVPDLVARAVPMTLEEDFEKVSGVFMEQATGLDLPKDDADVPTSFFGHLRPDAMHGAGLRSMADLQILDYLCMNMDRHQNNMLFTFDSAGHLCSVMGIDNDMSFGRKKLDDQDSVVNGTAMDDLYVISEGMKKAVLRLNEDMLTAALEGTGLSEAEIHAACDRLERLQDRLIDPQYLTDKNRVPGKLRIVPDGDWAGMKPRDLIPTDLARDNVFKMAAIVEDVSKWNHASKGDVIKPQQAPHFAETEHVDVLEQDALLQKGAEFDRLNEKLKQTEGFFHGSHEQFSELRNALDALHELNIPEDRQMDAQERMQYLALLDRVNIAANAYIAYKEPQHSTLSTGKTRLKTVLLWRKAAKSSPAP